MSNFQVYRKILSFSFVIFLIDMLILVILGGFSTLGFVIGGSNTSASLVGLAIGLVLGLIATALINIFVKNRVRAAQISIINKGVTEGSIPEHAFKEGFNEIRGRFSKITVFFFITYAIKGIFRQIGRGFTRVGRMVGGSAGESTTSIIDSAIQILIGYLCDCCLGWVLFRKEQNSAKAACEGAVIFFKHGKTLIRNIGRIFGMGLLSFVVIGGAFGGGLYAIFYANPQIFQPLSDAIASVDGPALEPQIIGIIVAVFGAMVIWTMLHTVLVRPFILVGVMRNYMKAGIENMPKEADFSELDKMSSRFARLHSSF